MDGGGKVVGLITHCTRTGIQESSSPSHLHKLLLFATSLRVCPRTPSVVMLRLVLAAAAGARMQYKRVASSIASPHNRLLFLSCSTGCSSSSRLVALKHQQHLLLRNSITSVGDGMPCCLSASIPCSFSTKSVCTIHFNDLGFDVRFSLPVCVASGRVFVIR